MLLKCQLSAMTRAYHMALPRFLAAAAVCALVAGAPVLASDIQDINQQFRKGDLAGALDNANRYLAKNPKDAQARFLKGLILADQGKTNDAIGLFTALTEDYPELPEPYNNLAVLYASQGKYEAAKDSLEKAIRTHPSYATAHENLGDIYAKMASLAYDKALALDSRNTAAQTKLALIKEMMGGEPRKAAVRPAVATAATTAAPAAKAAPPAESRAAAPAAKATPPAEPRSAAPAAPAADVEAAIAQWAQAWSRRDVAGYLAAYASGYSANGLSRTAWEAQRSARITTPKRIEVKLSDLKVEQEGDSATATFRQAYRSDRLNSTVTKTLKLALQNGQWRIVGETSR
jgi:tetratricopeptide (TPR) repeat protein